MSSKNKISFSKELQQFKLKDAIGKTVTCEDGIPRRVVEICGSNRYPWKAIINEEDETSNGGHFISVYSLAAQVIMNYLPTKDQIEAFNKSVRVSFKIPENGITKSHPLDGSNGKIVIA